MEQILCKTLLDLLWEKQTFISENTKQATFKPLNDLQYICAMHNLPQTKYTFLTFYNGKIGFSYIVIVKILHITKTLFTEKMSEGQIQATNQILNEIYNIVYINSQLPLQPSSYVETQLLPLHTIALPSTVTSQPIPSTSQHFQP